MTVTSPSPSPDIGVPAQCPVDWAIEMAKAVVRAADPGDWHTLWRVLADEIDEAKDKARCTGTAYPWEEIESVQVIAWEDAQKMLEDAIPLIQEPSERRARPRRGCL